MTKKSLIWTYLTQKDKKSATCNFCKVELTIGKGTSALAYHFRNKHSDKITPRLTTTPSKHRLDSTSQSESDSEQPPKKKPNLQVNSVQTTLFSSTKKA